MVNKISQEYDNPIDIVIYKIIDKQLNFYYKNNFTPNKLSILSILFGLLSLYTFYKDKYILSGTLFFLHYYYDCVDGKFARKYNMVTKFGDMLDHIGGILISVSLLILMYYKIINNQNNKSKIFKIFIPYTILLLLLLMFFECQEKIYNKNESKSLLTTNFFTKEQTINNIKYLRYFGPGTLIIYIIIIILLWKKI